MDEITKKKERKRVGRQKKKEKKGRQKKPTGKKNKGCVKFDMKKIW